MENAASNAFVVHLEKEINPNANRKTIIKGSRKGDK
jgi:hypothetical protein